MLLINPEIVRFGSALWSSVASVTIEQEAARLIAEPAHDGPYEVMVDVPRVRTTVTVAHQPTPNQPLLAVLGERDVLAIQAAAAGSDAGRLRIRVRAVVTAVRYRWLTPHTCQRLVTLIGEAEAGPLSPIEIDVLTTTRPD